MAVERTVSTDRLPPQAVDVERAVLSAMLIDPGAVGAVVEVLNEAAFYHTAHRKIYAAVISLYEKGQPVDQITVVQELARRQQLEEVGGAVAVAQLAGEVGTSANAEYHARIVQEKALRREMINISSQVATECYAETEDAFQLLERAEQRFFGLSQGSIQRGFKPLEGILHETFELVERAHKRAGALSGLTTGYRELDEKTAGLQSSDLIIVAGRPSMGKTAFGLCIARNVAVKEKVPVGVFSLEMSEQQIAQRLLCAESRVDSHRLRTGRLSDEEWMRLAAWSSKLVEAPIFIDDTPGISVLEMRAKARRLKAEHGVGLIIVDYLQLVTTHERIDNREQEIARISRSLKALSKELNIPLIACAQLSRAVETRGGDKRPILSDLRESGCLAGESLVVMADTGMRVPIRHLVGKKGFKVWALNEETLRLEAAEVTHAFCTGTKPVYRLETGLGRTIRATGNHKFRTLQGWKRFDELSPGERIALPRTIPSGDDKGLSDAEAALLGHLIGDGCTLPRHAIQYTTREIDLAKLVVRLAEQVYGSKIQPRVRQERRWYQVYLSAAEHLTHRVRNPVAAWLTQLSIFGLRSYEKRVPDALFSQPAATVAVFLRHLWATDGCIRPPRNGRGHPAIYYATSSERLAHDVQSLLLRLGINAVISSRDQAEKGRTQYHVMVMGRTDILSFADKVGAAGVYKTEALVRSREWCERRAANTNRDVIPSEVWRSFAVPAMRRNGITTRQMQSALGSAYSGTSLYKQNISRARAQRLSVAVGGDSQIAYLASSDIYWDEVWKVEPAGEEEVFDLTVPSHSNFLANDIVVHNSIEQDADVVMFLYRPEVYGIKDDQDQVQEGVAEVIIGKQRNGPLGTVTLTWLAEYGRFEEPEMYREEPF